MTPESVWDYPRPPAVVPTTDRIRVVHRGATVADTVRAVRVLETSQPPAFYIPADDVADELIIPGSGRSYCEWKGQARYWHVVVAGETFADCAWSYPDPTPDFARLRDHVAFYAGPFDRCTVDGEPVRPQPGGFYGGWITADLAGPFKGVPGSAGW